MASGFGLYGSQSRCYQIFVDLEECVKEAVHPVQCAQYVLDYKECLRHKKEFTRARELMEHVRKGQIEERKGKDWRDL